MKKASRIESGEEATVDVAGQVIDRMRKEKGFAEEQAEAVIEAQAILGTAVLKENSHIPVDADEHVLTPPRLVEIFADPRFVDLLLALQHFQKKILDYFVFDDPSDCNDEDELELLWENMQQVAQEILDLNSKVAELYVAISKPDEHEVSLFNQIEESHWYQVAFEQLFQLWQIMICPPDLRPNDPPIWTYETEMMIRDVAIAWSQSDQSQSAYRFSEVKREHTRHFLLFLQWFVEHQSALPQVNVVELNELYSEMVHIAHSILDET